MIQQEKYKYLGTNGVIVSPVHLEGIYSIKIIKLTAESGKRLTDGTNYCQTVEVSPEDVEKWVEV